MSTDIDKLLANENFETLPSNVEAEKAVLGAFLNNNENLDKVSDFLLLEHFFIPIHQKIFEAIAKVIEKGLVANPITLKNYFDQEDVFKKIGISCLDYLLKLSAHAAIVSNVFPYAKAIYDASLRRKLIVISQSTIDNIFKKSIDNEALDIIEQTEQKLFNLAMEGTSESGFKNIKVISDNAISNLEAARKRGVSINGVSTGLIDLDKVLSGMQKSDLIVLASRPSMGKTALAMSIGLNASVNFSKITQNGKPNSVGVFSLEMSSEQLYNRLLSVRTGIEGNKIRTGNVNKLEFAKLLEENEELNKLPIFIDDSPALTISAVRTRARRLKRQHNLGLIIIDYLQLLRSTKPIEANRVQEVGEISQGLKAIAKELDVPVLALSQLSRAVEGREDKRPQLSDLRESGNIEQDADVVMFIYREEYYLSRKIPPSTEIEEFANWQDQMEKVKNVADIIIAKQRNGPIGNINLKFDAKTTGFSNIDVREFQIAI